MKIPTFYWWTRSNNLPENFGDILNPFILDYFNIRYTHSKKWKNIKLDAIAIGSIIDKAGKGTVVLGSGIMNNKKKIYAEADFRLVRGPLTRKKILSAGGICPENYGDPGLLLPLICDESSKEYEIGFIPHFIEYETIKSRYPREFVINLQNNDPLYVARQISKCRKVVSSSLHGIIAAHAYGIPAAWAWNNESFKQWDTWTDTKFLDYFESVKISPIKSSFDNPVFVKADVNIKNIVDTFIDYSKELN